MIGLSSLSNYRYSVIMKAKVFVSYTISLFLLIQVGV